MNRSHDPSHTRQNNKHDIQRPWHPQLAHQRPTQYRSTDPGPTRCAALQHHRRPNKRPLGPTKPYHSTPARPAGVAEGCRGSSLAAHVHTPAVLLRPQNNKITRPQPANNTSHADQRYLKSPVCTGDFRYLEEDTLSPHCWCTVLGSLRAAACYMLRRGATRQGTKAA